MYMELKSQKVGQKASNDFLCQTENHGVRTIVGIELNKTKSKHNKKNSVRAQFERFVKIGLVKANLKPSFSAFRPVPTPGLAWMTTKL